MMDIRVALLVAVSLLATVGHCENINVTIELLCHSCNVSTSGIEYLLESDSTMSCFVNVTCNPEVNDGSASWMDFLNDTMNGK